MTHRNAHRTDRSRLLAAVVVLSLVGSLGCQLCFRENDSPPPQLRLAFSPFEGADFCTADPLEGFFLLAMILLQGGGYTPGSEFLTSVGQTTMPPPGLARIDLTALDDPQVRFFGRQYMSTDGAVEFLGDDPARRYLADSNPAQTVGRRGFFVNPEQNTLVVLNAATGDEIRQIRVGSDPRGVAASRDGTRLYVGNNGSGSVTPIDLATLEALPSISLNGAGQPADVAISPDGTTLYVVNGADSGSLFFIDVASGEILENLRTGRQSTKVTLSPDGATAYVANTGGGNVAVIDVLSRTVVGTLNVSAANEVVVSPDGETVYVAAGTAAGRVLAFDAASFQEIDEWNVGQAPQGATVSPDGNLLLVSNSGSEELHVIDLAIGEIVAVIDVPLGLGPLVALPVS